MRLRRRVIPATSARWSEPVLNSESARALCAAAKPNGIDVSAANNATRVLAKNHCSASVSRARSATSGSSTTRAGFVGDGIRIRLRTIADRQDLRRRAMYSAPAESTTATAQRKRERPKLSTLCQSDDDFAGRRVVGPGCRDLGILRGGAATGRKTTRRFCFDVASISARRSSVSAVA